MVRGKGGGADYEDNPPAKVIYAGDTAIMGSVRANKL
jgi:hypothetical protein